MEPYLALFLIVVVLAFIAAWRWMPSGYLTAMTGTSSAALIALYEVAQEMAPQLKMLLPEEQRWIVVIALFMLTVAARFRKRAAS